MNPINRRREDNKNYLRIKSFSAAFNQLLAFWKSGILFVYIFLFLFLSFRSKGRSELKFRVDSNDNQASFLTELE